MKRSQLLHRIADETPDQKAAREVVKLIRKLRWIGLEHEAEQLQTALGGFPSDKRASLLAGPHGTDRAFLRLQLAACRPRQKWR